MPTSDDAANPTWDRAANRGVEMIELSLIGVIVLGVVTLYICFRWRAMLDSNYNTQQSTGTAGVWLAALMHLTSLVTLSASLILIPYYNEVAVILPVLIMVLYCVEIYLIKHLASRWKKSPIFKLVLLAPLFGCILVILILLENRYENG